MSGPSCQGSIQGTRIKVLYKSQVRVVEPADLRPERMRHKSIPLTYKSPYSNGALLIVVFGILQRTENWVNKVKMFK